MAGKTKICTNNESWLQTTKATSGTLDPDDDDVKKNEDSDTEDAKVAHVQSLTRLPTQQTQRVLEFALMVPEVELNWAQRPLRAALSTNSLLITEAARANDVLFPYFQFFVRHN